jgi:hypothetical protein
MKGNNMNKDYNNFKPFRYLTPKPKKYPKIRKREYKPIKESKAVSMWSGMYQNAFGLVFIAISLGIGVDS